MQPTSPAAFLLPPVSQTFLRVFFRDFSFTTDKPKVYQKITISLFYITFLVPTILTCIFSLPRAELFEHVYIFIF